MTPETAQIPLTMEVFGDRPWAITPAGINSVFSSLQHPDFEAAARAVSQPASDAIPISGGVAVLGIRGPLVPYRSIWTWLLGGTAVEEVSDDLSAALNDPQVRSILLAINSPGGQIDGINELANKIRAVNSEKPVTAYVAGLAASGAYWLASAAGRIVADETAQLGSIGVLATVFDDSEADARHGIKRFDVVSSQSPLKRTDPATEEGRGELQKLVDALAQVFIAKVAQFRGTSEEKVASDFGRGAVLPARAALEAGMADSLGSLEGLLAGEPDMPTRQMRDKPGMRVEAAAPFDEQELEDATENGNLNSDPVNCPPDTDCQGGGEDEENDEDQDDESEGTEQTPDESSIPKGETDLSKPTEDRQRIAAILTCEEAKGREELARTLALDIENTFSVDAARKILSAAPASKPNALEARMGQIENPKVGVPGDSSEEDTPAVEVQRILAFVPKNRLRAQRVQ